MDESRARLKWLWILFFASGCAALIYETVWLQLLELVIGSSGISVGLLLGTFMGGLCVGSLLLSRIIPASHHPLRVYAFLELGTGLMGIGVLFALPRIAGLYVALHGHGLLVRALVSAVCLLPPTLLMGATLPAASRYVRPNPDRASWMGFFYAGNTIGGVAGCLLAAFLLLRVLDMPAAVFTAAAINLGAACVAFALARRGSYEAGDTSPQPEEPLSPGDFFVLLAILASGFSALGAEVVWTRILSLLLGATVYSFAIILAVFLAGLGLGSSAGSSLARSRANPRVALALCQILLGAAIAWTAFAVARLLPYWPLSPDSYTSDSGHWQLFALDLLRAAFAVLPPTLLWGASFPLAIAATSRAGGDPGRTVGRVYAANTIGAILGSLGFSLLAVPALGTQNCERILIAAAGAGALLAAGSAVDRARIPIKAAAAALTALAGVAFLAARVARVPWPLIAWGRFCPTYISDVHPEVTDESFEPKEEWHCTYVGEGMNVSVAVTRMGDYRYFHGAGKVQASSLPQDMRLQRMLGHLSVLAARSPESVQDVLVVACGAGVTAGTFLLYPGVRDIVICDIEPLVPKVVAPMFGRENYHIVDGIDQANPHTVDGKRVRVVYDDGRHYIRTLLPDAKFDVITSDPIDPWVKGSAALNTIEYYQMCKSHLKPGGVMTLWMPFYESNLESAKSLIATFFQVFPDGMIFSNEQQYQGYDAVLLGQSEGSEINLDRLEAMLGRDDCLRARQSLLEVGFGSWAEGRPLTDLLATFTVRGADLRPWMENAQINRDRDLRLQYLAGMWLNSYQGTKILQSILSYYRFPDGVFAGSAPKLQALRLALSLAGRRSQGSSD